MSKTVWVLTSEYNDYDQHGEYFEAVWENKPSTQQLVEYFKNGNDAHYSDIMAALDFILHIQNGGGRREYEEHWYNLNEVECN